MLSEKKDQSSEDNGSVGLDVPSSQGLAELFLHLPSDVLLHRDIFWIADWNPYFSAVLGVTVKGLQDHADRCRNESNRKQKTICPSESWSILLEVAENPIFPELT